ncbi:MAG TPA: hypothetical protein VMX56_02720 [Anaerolineales bacterium]|nr:hypothetical protein [Anaerolineales bacterium]
MEKQITTGLKNTFLLHSIMMAIFALNYIFTPVWWGNLTGCLSNQVPQVFRLFGTTILGYAISSFLSYRETAWEKVKIVVQMNCVITALFPIMLVLALLFWDLPSIGWMYFVVMSGFGVAFNYFYFKK